MMSGPPIKIYTPEFWAKAAFTEGGRAHWWREDGDTWISACGAKPGLPAMFFEPGSFPLCKTCSRKAKP